MHHNRVSSNDNDDETDWVSMLADVEHQLKKKDNPEINIVFTFRDREPLSAEESARRHEVVRRLAEWEKRKKAGLIPEGLTYSDFIRDVKT
jgi:hypothetical protein